MSHFLRSSIQQVVLGLGLVLSCQNFAQGEQKLNFLALNPIRTNQHWWQMEGARLLLRLRLEYLLNKLPVRRARKYCLGIGK
jgi:hypothetical protein